ncbi:Predicted DNA-binding protein, MmcQ/YjbR family [Paenimyroides aquimaris]|uniref:Predicted DNA-binding protein, MmcQ/YjbR family n=1 Tax=Paenimyroides marinum TaxID=1159016 RepID=A0A1H6JSW5_9FLAO|nr:MmcQ/YjbR family DNA-binding protein [Paenimyroides aquimaris]SEH65662.1 Predicted DNA-binding protein, MmcQ/YjbR family [Paenimyroides aquimaris]
MNNIEDFRNYCLSFKGVTEKFPFDESTLVFYVMNKMFCLVDIEAFDYCNLKCDPEEAEELRAQYNGIKPGYHMSKKHWNSVYFNSDISENQIKEMVVKSYDLVVKGLTKKDRALLETIQ